MKRDKALKSRVLRSKVVSMVSIALVLFVLGAIGYATAGIFRSAHKVSEGVTMIVELRDGLQEPHRDSLASVLAADAMVSEVKFVSKDEKLADEEFRKAFDVDIKGVLGDNPLPDSFDVTLSAASADGEQLAAFVERCATMDGVDYVACPAQLLERVHDVLGTMRVLLLVFGGAMLIISLVLLNNTIRLSIFSRREQINTMKLVGATKWFIIRPFLADSAVQGLLAGVVAVVLFAGALLGIDHYMPELGISANLPMAGVTAAAMVGVGIVLAVLFTLFAVNKFVNMKSNKIFLY